MSKIRKDNQFVTQITVVEAEPGKRKEWNHFGEVTEEIAPDLYEVTYLQAAKAA
jgi:hypothetical protein